MLSFLLLLYGMVAPALICTYFFFPKLNLGERLLWTAILSLVIIPLLIYFLNMAVSVPINTATILTVATCLNVGGGVGLLLRERRSKRV